MKNTARSATVVVATVAADTPVGAMWPAQSERLAPGQVTVRATDYTPASGQTFQLFAAMKSEGERVPATIRVKTFRNGEWVTLTGAVMHTDRDNHYRIRMVLQMKGERLLRVIGNRTATTSRQRARPSPSLSTSEATGTIT